MANSARIIFVPGSLAPRYGSGTELTLEEIVITEEGTEQGLPIVDIKMRDAVGEFYLLTMTGRILNSISTAVRGVNLRNYGVEEP